MSQFLRLLIMVLPCLFAAPLLQADEFSDTINRLDQGRFSDKREVLAQLQAMRDQRSLPILKAMQDGQLHTVEEDSDSPMAGVLVIETEQGDKSTYHDALSGEPVDLGDDPDLDKVRTNNRLRREIGTVIASLELSSDNTGERLAAAQNLIKNSDPNLVDLLRDAYVLEKSGKVKNKLAIAIAMVDINAGEAAIRLNAIEVLGGALEPEALGALRPLVEQQDDGSYIEPNDNIREAAQNSIERIEGKVKFYGFAENIFFGLSLGSVLLLAAVGLAITFGVMGVINMAHGEMIMLGAYTTFAVQQLFPDLIEGSLFIAVPAAFLVSGCVGMLIERLVIRHLYGRPLETLLATFGISLILQQAVRSYRSNNVPVITPDWMSGSFEINAALSLTYNRFYIIWFSFFVVIGLMLLTKKTFFGLQMRAVTQNRAMANSMGIRSGWVDALTFGLGSGIAGIAGVALSQLTNVGPNLGQGYIIDSFMVVVFGGVGNLFGTVFAALGLGIINKFLEPVAGAVLGKIIVLVFIILFIQWRPRGLFALKGRFADD